MKPCTCDEHRLPIKVVLTGGPGAGKTAVLELIRQALCQHTKILPEAAGIVFGGGFPRSIEPHVKRAAQKAIFFVQRELEATAEGPGRSWVLCDRGTVDGAAYWVGPGELWEAVGTTHAEQLSRYDAVIHMRTPANSDYNHNNPLRVESAEQARAIDERLAQAWAHHPRRFFVEAEADFLVKAEKAIAIVRQLLG